MLTELASASALDHPLLVERESPKRAAVLVVSSDRGLCGAYNANVLRRSEELFSLLREEGKEPVIYAVGRKALGYYSFRQRDVSGVLDRLLRAARPTSTRTRSRTTLVTAFMAGVDDEGDDPGDDGILGRRRTAHRVHRVQVDAVAVGGRPAGRADGGRVRGRRGARRRSAHAVLVRAERRDTVRRACCRGTSPPASSRRCSKRRRRSRRRAGAR